MGVSSLFQLGSNILDQTAFATQSVKGVEIEALIVGLDSKDIAIRKKSFAQLSELGDTVEVCLKKQLAAADCSAEQRQKITLLLEAATERHIVETRALSVLEYIGTREARDLIDQLAAGAPETFLTNEAKLTANRMKKKW